MSLMKNKHVVIAALASFVAAVAVFVIIIVNIKVNQNESEISLLNTDAKRCVRIFTDKGCGSGVILEVTDDKVLVVSNLHVLSDWNENGVVEFMNGTRCFGQVFGADEDYDLCFLEIPRSELANADLYDYLKDESMQSFRKAINDNSMDTVDFHTYYLFGNSGASCLHGKVSLKKEYIYELEKDMLIGKCETFEGMSGAPAFDDAGNLIGIICAGGDNDTVIIVAYEDIAKALNS